MLLTRFFVLVFFGLPAWPAAAAPAPKTFALGPFTVSVVDETRAGLRRLRRRVRCVC